ncbi:MAG: hypothetical protein WBD30_01870 [Bacteroidota bacterium]
MATHTQYARFFFHPVLYPLRMRNRTFLILWPLCLCMLGLAPADSRDERDESLRLLKPADDTDRNYTDAGNIGLTISNFGTIGTRNSYWPDQPSCEYPLGSRIEHVYQGGLWVGAVSRISGEQRVSTGATDRASGSRIGQGYEYTSDIGSGLVERSSLSESQFFSEDAISHQDFLGFYTDLNRTNPTTGDTIPEHTPLGLSVRQESYVWNFPFADFFVILNYTIYNVGADTLDSVYVGFWNNAVVRNTNNVRPGTPGYFNHGGNGLLDTIRMKYTFDFDGIPTPPAADSYIGIKLLGCNPFPRSIDSLADLRQRAYYNTWRFRSSSGDVDYFSPDDDAENINGARSRYDRLTASLPQQKIASLRLQADNMTTLLSTGSFGTLFPGDSLNVVFGLICARKAGTELARNDTYEQRKTLTSNAAFCQQAYDGEDINGNNRLDPGEDINGNGKLDRYLLPQPPSPPKVRVELASRSIEVYWDRSTSELSIDPITKEMDFEGYRIFRTNATPESADPSELFLTLSLAGEFDVPDNGVGYNTGFGQIELTEPEYFPGDTVAYWYKFPPAGAGVTHLNGWQYLYGVAAFDRGDSAAGVTSLQSRVEVRRVVPGTPATSDPDERVGVYPNPYYATAAWDGLGERNRKIYFYNLPRRSEILVYTLAGDVVAEILHDANTYDASDIEWFRRFEGSGTAAEFAGGEHAWDLISKFDQAIATGLYLFTVRDLETGETKTGKFVVIK